MITFKHRGSFKNTETFFKKLLKRDFLSNLDKYGKMGVEALSAATPRDTGKTADSWDYSIEESKNGVKIVWTNSNVNKGVNIALLLQYGHGTRNGGYVMGRDYINPAMQPIFEQILESAWGEVKGL